MAGVYQSQADIDASPENTLATVTPGDLKFADVNRDGKITPEDRTMIGNPTPDFTYGLSLGVNYKNWSLGIDMMGQHGNEIFRTWDNYNFAQFNYLSQHGPLARRRYLQQPAVAELQTFYQQPEFGVLYRRRQLLPYP